jgi:quinol monooxygenase YgiN
MLIIAGEISMQPGTRQQFFDAVAPLVAATLQEAGCRSYAFTPDPDEHDLIRLYELWDDEEALAGHMASSHMADWRRRSAALPMASRDLKCYTISDVRQI